MRFKEKYIYFCAFSTRHNIHDRVLTKCVCDQCPPPSYHPRSRAQIPQTKEEIDQQRGQATTDGLHSGAAAKTQNGVPDKSLSDRAEAAEPGAGTGPERVPDQDLVSEQAGQNQKGHRLQEQSGLTPDGAGTVQSQHRHVKRREIRQRLISSEERLLTKKSL